MCYRYEFIFCSFRETFNGHFSLLFCHVLKENNKIVSFFFCTGNPQGSSNRTIRIHGKHGHLNNVAKEFVKIHRTLFNVQF
jgi:hypothetical protein